MPKRSAVKEYLAKIGSKGGKAKGPRKARSPEHYAKMVEAKKAKRAASSAPVGKRKANRETAVQEAKR